MSHLEKGSALCHLKKRLEILTTVLFGIRQVRECNQLFHVGVLPFSKKNLNFLSLSSTSS